MSTHRSTKMLLTLFLGSGAGHVAIAGTTVIEQPGRGTNRIEVTGNQVDGKRSPTKCGLRADSGSTNVNSVNISGQSLKGKTIIVTDGTPGDCELKSGNPGSKTSTVNINSVNIR
jgi:hypothetical protein